MQTRQPAAPEPPAVSLCSLLSSPADYDGKKIRIRAEYNLGFEWSYFDDASCKEYAVKTTPFWTANVVWAEFGESVNSSTEPAAYEKLKVARSLCCPDGWRTRQTEMVFTGKFFKAGDKGYGHEERYAFKLVVEKVEDVGESKLIDP
jgi:hypothetical protein